VTFESGSNLRQLAHSAFVGCPHLNSLCIPASVESIGERCFSDDLPEGSASGLETLTFEPGSNLIRIQAAAFDSCRGLRSICLPRSVSEIDGATFRRSCFSRIEIEPGNTHFSVRADFLLDFGGVCIVFYFGSDEEVQIPDEIEKIGADSFYSKTAIRSVSFGRESRLWSFGASSFARCSSLNAIHIPSTVREIKSQTFFFCWRLTVVTFESMSELVQIEEKAFWCCPSLESLCIPSSVESIAGFCFRGCAAISTFVFECPSHLRELRSLIESPIRSLDIPDSVEVLEAMIPMRAYRCTLKFGEGSKVGWIRLGRAEPPRDCLVRVHSVRAFVRVPAHRLKVFRCSQEFV
jgi:hypothetical protein